MAPRRMRLGRPAVIADRPVCFLASGRWQGGRHVASPLFTCSCPARFAATPQAPRSPWFHPTADAGGGRGICRNARGLATGDVAARAVRRPVVSRRVPLPALGPLCPLHTGLWARFSLRWTTRSVLG